MNVTLKEETLNSLAQKLDEFNQVLTTEEQALLLTIFRLGSNALAQIGQKADTESAALGSARPSIATPSTGVLSQSIKAAFRPALARGLTGINLAASGVEVTGGVKWSA